MHSFYTLCVLATTALVTLTSAAPLSPSGTDLGRSIGVDTAGGALGNVPKVQPPTAIDESRGTLDKDILPPPISPGLTEEPPSLYAILDNTKTKLAAISDKMDETPVDEKKAADIVTETTAVIAAMFDQTEALSGQPEETIFAKNDGLASADEIAQLFHDVFSLLASIRAKPALKGTIINLVPLGQFLDNVLVAIFGTNPNDRIRQVLGALLQNIFGAGFAVTPA
ncbi:hypothetical protein H0H81_012161 [Sphagnurus paluster]|uniref:Uncharacterized protein n=1 Tax=Sphagnurus paluster TaxID=117069 RepID=A0A9P7FY73_9AGAR|nr:hypothetical protein H0H81_012161 [Sphagnurus paluster]